MKNIFWLFETKDATLLKVMFEREKMKAIEKLVSGLVGCFACWLDWLAGWLSGWLAEWTDWTGWMAEWLDWLAGWLD